MMWPSPWGLQRRAVSTPRGETREGEKNSSRPYCRRRRYAFLWVLPPGSSAQGLRRGLAWACAGWIERWGNLVGWIARRAHGSPRIPSSSWVGVLALSMEVRNPFSGRPSSQFQFAPCVDRNSAPLGVLASHRRPCRCGTRAPPLRESGGWGWRVRRRIANDRWRLEPLIPLSFQWIVAEDRETEG
jgi:hypothetical protein